MRPVRKADNPTLSCAVVMKSGNLNFLETSGPLQACNGTDLPLPFNLYVVHSPIQNKKYLYIHFNQNVNDLFIFLRHTIKKNISIVIRSYEPTDTYVNTEV